MGCFVGAGRHWAPGILYFVGLPWQGVFIATGSEAREEGMTRWKTDAVGLSAGGPDRVLGSLV